MIVIVIVRENLLKWLAMQSSIYKFPFWDFPIKNNYLSIAIGGFVPRPLQKPTSINAQVHWYITECDLHTASVYISTYCKNISKSLMPCNECKSCANSYHITLARNNDKESQYIFRTSKIFKNILILQLVTRCEAHVRRGAAEQTVWWTRTKMFGTAMVEYSPWEPDMSRSF